MDALAGATGGRPSPPAGPPEESAGQVVGPPGGSEGLRVLVGRPARESACECERRSDLSLPQALNLVNGKTISDAVGDSAGRVAKAILGGRADKEIVEELYLAALSRPATADEAALGMKYLQG